MKRLFTLCFILIISQSTFSQSTRIWSTYYGGSGEDPNSTYGGPCNIASATDNSANVYVVGNTNSTSGIATAGSHQSSFGGGQYDGFLVKFDASGNRIWSTYYGGSGYEFLYDVITDAGGNVYIVGQTNSTNNIFFNGWDGTLNSGGDAFLVKFNSAGVRQWATYFGGNGSEGFFDIEIDPFGNIYCSGYTFSTSGLAFGGFQNTHGGGTCDGFLVKFNALGTALWATYYGGPGYDVGGGITCDGLGNIYFIGDTPSTTGIASGGFQNTYGGGTNDIFLVKFDGNCNRLWATYYGSSGNEQSTLLGLDCDAANNVYIAGYTSSSAGIASGGFQNTYGGGASDAFIVKFNSAGSRLWATYYGGIGADKNAGLIVNSVSGNIYLSGNTDSPNGIYYNGGFQSSLGGNMDGFMARFDLSGNMISGTYYGGTNFDEIQAICLDPNGNVYASGRTASTNSISSGGFQNAYGGGAHDAFLVKFYGCSFSSISGSTTVCSQGAATVYSIEPVPAATSYSWALPAGWSGSSSSTSVSVVPSSTGILTVTAINGCSANPQQTLNISVNPSPTISVNSGSICSGQTFTIVPAGASIYTIQGGSVAVSPTSNSSYTVIGEDALGCISASAAISNVTVNPIPVISINSGSICVGNSFTLIPTGASTYTYQGGNAVVSPIVNTSYTVAGASSAGCISQIFATSNVMVNPLPTITVNSGSICSGQSFTVLPTGASTYTISGGSSVVNPSASTNYSVSGTSINGCTSANSAVSSLIVFQLPNVTVNSTSSVICIGETTTLHANGASTYTWNTGANSFFVIVNPTLTTTYTIIGTDSNGCENVATYVQEVSECAGIETNNLSGHKLRVYPNPNNGSFSIDAPLEMSIVIVSAIGKIVYEKHLDSGINVIRLSGLAKGVYFISTQEQGNSFNSKLIIQ